MCAHMSMHKRVRCHLFTDTVRRHTLAAIRSPEVADAPPRERVLHAVGAVLVEGLAVAGGGLGAVGRIDR